jgi:hypothetical protein
VRCGRGLLQLAGEERSPVCFEPKLAGKPGVCTLASWSPFGQATSDDVGLSVCGSLIGDAADAPLGPGGPELCGRRASS